MSLTEIVEKYGVEPASSFKDIPLWDFISCIYKTDS